MQNAERRHPSLFDDETRLLHAKALRLGLRQRTPFGHRLVMAQFGSIPQDVFQHEEKIS